MKSFPQSLGRNAPCVPRSVGASRTHPVAQAVAAPQLSPKEAGTEGAKNQLEALKRMSKIVADSGEINQIKRYKPIDSTTNPSLLYKAVQVPEYQHFLSDAIAVEDGPSDDTSRPYARIADVLSVNVGLELLKIVPGRVSTEVDAHLSYDTQKTVDKALRLVDLYTSKGFDLKSKRIYIKIASTWEGIRACEILQKQGIDTNMTLLFSFAQAGACADAGASLISPFVGRIMDWYKKKEGRDFAPHEDPGVLSVKKIYKYYKKYKYDTIVMAASFRNVGEITELAGCDNITIAPSLLGELEASTEPLPRKLWPEMGGADEEQIDFGGSHYDTFKKWHEEDQMAVDKLKEGIEGFAKDQKSLEKLIGDLKDHV
jgi:transaldolase